MERIINADFKKFFSNKNIYFCALGIGTAFVLNCANQILSGRYSATVTDYLSNNLSDDVLLVCFIFCIVGGGFLYCSEEKYNFLYMEIQRIGVTKFTLSKIIVSMTGGFVTAFAGILIGGTGIEIMIFMKRGESYFPEPLECLNFACSAFLFCTLCGILSTLGFVVTTVLTDYYIGLSLPILIYYVIVIFNSWLHIPDRLRIESVYFLYSNLNEHYHYSPYIIYGILYSFCLLILFYTIAKSRIQRRMEHA